MNAAPIKHRSVRHDYYRVETRGGERRWLAVPLDTPTKLVTTPVLAPRVRAA